MSNREITPQYLREAVDYDQYTGQMYWRIRPLHHFKNQRGMTQTNAARAGKPAFDCPHTQGYLHGRINNKLMFAHRVAWAIFYGKHPDGEIDHLNHDRKDNRIENLRLVDRLSNGKNLSMPISNKSGIIGVHWANIAQRWCAQIRVDNKIKHLGYFKNMEEAANARRMAEIKYGFHENHGK